MEADSHDEEIGVIQEMDMIQEIDTMIQEFVKNIFNLDDDVNEWKTAGSCSEHECNQCETFDSPFDKIIEENLMLSDTVRRPPNKTPDCLSPKRI